MAKLIYLLDGKIVGEYLIEKERVTIGRRPTNDIHIDNLAVSGEHATILTLGSDSFLEDLNSTNGTLVNKQLIKKHVLQHNDVIEFGKYQLKFLNQEAGTKKNNPDGFADTVVMKPAVKSAEVVGIKEAETPHPETVVATLPVEETAPQIAAEVPQPKPQREPDANAVGYIQVLSGETAGLEIALDKTLTRLGDAGAQQAVVTKRSNGYFLTHLEGARHPLVNGESIGSQAYALNDHDVIEIAGAKMEFYLA